MVWTIPACTLCRVQAVFKARFNVFEIQSLNLKADSLVTKSIQFAHRIQCIQWKSFRTSFKELWEHATLVTRRKFYCAPRAPLHGSSGKCKSIWLRCSSNASSFDECHSAYFDRLVLRCCQYWGDFRERVFEILRGSSRFFSEFLSGEVAYHQKTVSQKTIRELLKASLSIMHWVLKVFSAISLCNIRSDVRWQQ